MVSDSMSRHPVYISSNTVYWVQLSAWLSCYNPIRVERPNPSTTIITILKQTKNGDG